MVSVDDLRISLEIDETSKLGKLQKQLKAIVGEKGEKDFDIGALDPDLKRDLAIIKDRIIKFTPTVLISENLKEAALSLAGDLKKDTNLRDVLLQRYNINIDKYETFLEELFNVALGISKQNNDQQKGFIAEMTKFRAIATMAKGDRETLVKRLTRMMLEAGFHEKIVDIFREAGIKLLSKPPMFELTKKSIGKSFDDIIEEYRLEEPGKFLELMDIFDKNSDALKAISEAYTFMKGDVLDITEITQDIIENDKELRMIIVAQVASAIKKSNWMVEQFYKAAKTFFTKGKAFAVGGPAYLDTVVHRFSKEALEQLEIEHIVGAKIDESMNNFLVEYKTVAGKSEVDYDATKRIIKQHYDEIFFVVEEYTQGAIDYIVEFMQKEEHKGKKIGLYRLLPRTVEKLIGIERDLDSLEKEAKESLERDKEEEDEAKEQEGDLEKTRAMLEDLEEWAEKPSVGGEDLKKEHLDAEAKQLEEMAKLLGEVKETTDDTNKEVKKKSDEPKVEKMDD